MWLTFMLLMTIWFILKVFLGKGGYVHIILVGAISILVVQIIAYRKTQYHKSSSGS